MFDLNGALAGFVVGVASGIFLMYKLAQRARGQVPPVQPMRRPVRDSDLLDETGQSIFLENKGVRK